MRIAQAQFTDVREQPGVAAAPVTIRHFAGFDGLRLLAALAVLYSHAFPIANAYDTDEPLGRLLGIGNVLGVYGVYTFFIISGYLLAHSLERDGSGLRFALNRTLRI